MSHKVNVLMTGAGAPGAPGIIRCLLQSDWINLVVADCDPQASGRYLHNNFVQIPKADDESFTQKVLQLALENQIHVILPLVTTELFPLAKNKEVFLQKGIRVLVSPHSAIEIANNKAACYSFLKERAIPTPAFRTARTTEEFIHAAFELGHPQKDFCFKPSVSNGSRGFRIVSDAIDESDQLFHQKPYNTYITYPHALSILSAKPFPELLVTEYLPGEEYTVDCLAENGTAKLIIPRLRQKMVNDICVKGRFIHDNHIVQYATRIIEAIGLHGNIELQVKRTAQGAPLLLEITPRMKGTIAAALGAGVNLPLLAIKQELGMPIESNEMNVIWGTQFSRYWTEVFY